MHSLLSSSLLTELPEIWLAGFLKSGLGLGESGRLIARSLQEAGVPLVTHAWEKPDITSVPFADSPTRAPTTAPGISIVSLNGDQLAHFIKTGGQAFFDNRYVISIWFWELEDLPRHMVAGFQYVDEVWAATPFMQAALQRQSGDVPVRLFTHPVPIPNGDAITARQRFPFEDRFVFLFAFDYQSCVKRKNPGGVCEAFALAFPQPLPGGPLCIIKSINGSLHAIDFTLLRQRWAHRPDIIMMDGFLSVADRDLLTWRADACISLHRAEGLGLTLMEAMALGKPCIATAYSGNLAFMQDAHSWLIPCTRAPVGPGSIHYDAAQIWAEPDPAAAAAAIQEVYTQSPAVLAKAAAGMEHVRTFHSPLACGTGLTRLLQEVAGKKPRTRTLPTSSSARAEAFAALATLRQAEKTPAIPISFWNLPTTLNQLKKESARTAREERRAISLTLAALKHQDEAQQARTANLQGQINRLMRQLTEAVARLPGTPPL